MRDMELPQGVLGNSIRKARLDKGLTQEKLAELIDITPNHVNQLERERRKPSFEVLQRLVQALDFSLDSLFSDANDNEQEMKDKIRLCINHCDVHELRVVYATVEAMLKKA